MTAAASRSEVPRRCRPGVVAFAIVAAVSLHLLGWFVLQWMSVAGSLGAKKSGEPNRNALSVRLIPVMPEPERAPAAHAGVRESKGRSGVAATPRIATRSLSATQRSVLASPAQDRHGDQPDSVPIPEVDWGRDLATIGARRTTGRGSVAATVGALGASSALPAARRDTVDERLASGVSNARRADCRHAHSGAGLLALPMLALDAVRDTGCKW